MLYWSDLADNIIKEEYRMSIYDFKPQVFEIPNDQYVWACFKHKWTEEVMWHLWSNNSRSWIPANKDAVPKILLMRQLTGAL